MGFCTSYRPSSSQDRKYLHSRYLFGRLRLTITSFRIKKSPLILIYQFLCWLANYSIKKNPAFKRIKFPILILNWLFETKIFNYICHRLCFHFCIHHLLLPLEIWVNGTRTCSVGCFKCTRSVIVTFEVDYI